MRFLRMAVLATLVLGCVEPELGELEQPIVGGTFTSDYPGVVQTYFSGFLCTATVVAPRILITAAHCVDHVVGTPAVAQGQVYFGPDGENPDKTIATADVRMHRLYDGDNFARSDIALILLAEDAIVDAVPIAPKIINDRDLVDHMEIGDLVTVVGYGISNPEQQTGTGTKRIAQIPLTGLARAHVVDGNDVKNTCQGDSGGPHMFEIDGEERIIAVTSFGFSGCRGTSQHTRVDAHLEAWVYPVMDRWDGPCKLDGACVTTGCRTPDPDCDPCGFDDVCAENCPQVDLDCPLGTGFRQACSAATECESRVCLDADTAGYCSQVCDPDDVSATCGAGMECVVVADGGTEPVCRKATPDPDDEGDDDGGCGCRVGGGNQGSVPGALWLLLGLAALGASRLTRARGADT